MAPYYLYGMSASLYTAKARSYLRKRGIDFVERAVGHAHYQQDIMPTIGRLIMPVLETPEGQLVQDTVDIVDFLEESVPPDHPLWPATPRQLVTAHLLELFGGEGLLRPAMHYRWNFDDENLAFLAQDFAGCMIMGGDTAQRAQVFEMASGRMRSAAVAFGVTPDSIPTIEASYQEFLSLFSAHLETAPYLLGGRPTNADLGFVGPMFPHLARDPHPSALMKTTAWRVWRWCERMQAPGMDAPEYGDYPAALFADDEIPPTLRNLLRYIAAEHREELLVQVVAIDEWLAANEVHEGEVINGKPARRMLGQVTFDWRGLPLTISVVPYRLYVLQRMQDAFLGLEPAEQTKVAELFEELGLDLLLTVRARRRVERANNREVWGALQDPSL